MTDPEVLDSGAMAALEAMAGGDRQFMVELIDTWMADATGQIAAIEHALATGEADTLRRAAHTLKSTSQSLGVPQLARACAEIEAYAKIERTDAVTASMTHLHYCHEQACAVLLALRRSLSEDL